MRTVALGVRFLLELCILASIAAWAAHLRLAPVARVAIGAAACVGAAVLWGLTLSPKRRLDPPAPIRLVLEAVLFLVAAAALWDVGRSELAAALLAVAVVDRIALAVLR